MDKLKENQKVKALYEAVGSFIQEGVDLNKLKVAEITEKAGIGKGTAYDYFSSKEDIIAKAIVFLSEETIRDTIQEMEKLSSYKEKLYYIFESIESRNFERECLTKVLHLTTRPGALGEKIKEVMHGQEGTKANPTALFHYLAEIGIKEKILNMDLPVHYMVVAMASKAMSYIIYSNQKHMLPIEERENMKDLIYEGILRDIGR